LTSTSIIVSFWVHILAWPYRQPLLVAVLGVALLVRASQRGDIQLFFKNKKWAGIGILAYAGAALFAVCRPSYPSGTYDMFLVTPMIYLAAAPLRAFPELAGRRTNRQSRRRLIFGLVLVLLFTAIDGARYANMVRAIRQLSHSQPDWSRRIAEADPDVPETGSSTGMAEVRHVLARTLAPCKWWVGDSAERITAVVRNIQMTRPVRSLAIWGWKPGVYVLTGIPSSSRYFIAPVGVKEVQMQNHYWTRFLGDLRQKPPDLFIDAIRRWDRFGWTEDDGYESVPQLRKFIEDNYILVDELTLIKGTKPVRFFVRRESASQPQ
jgi:hypothetical protein